MGINLLQFIAPNETTGVVNNLISEINAVGLNTYAVVTKTDTATATLTAANMTAAHDIVYILMTGTTSGSTLTLDTVANLVAALQGQWGPNVNVVGTTFVIRVINSGGTNTWTVTTATGWGTLNGTQTVANNTWRDFVATITTATTATWTSVGIGTQS